MPDIEQKLIIKAIANGFSNVNQQILDSGKAFGESSIKAELAANKADKYQSAIKKLAKNVDEGRITQDQASAAAQKYADRLGLTADKSDVLAKKSEMMGNALKAGVVAGAGVAVAALVKLGKASVEVASNVEEAASKFEYTFGPAAKSTGTSLDEFAGAANRSRFEMRAMAADVGALTESTLGSKEAAGAMSVEVTKLAVDLASFNNVTEDEALTALKAGLIGEAEPMRRFGVLLSATAVEARVMADNIGVTKGEITDAMKVQARYNIIMDQTSTAQGDAIRTSDSYANVSRGLEASIKDLEAAIGEGLLPTMTKAKGVTAELVGGLAGFWGASNQLRQAEEDGIITHGEYLKAQARLTYGSKDASDVINELSQKYIIQSNELERLSQTAASADILFSNYLSTEKEAAEVNEKTGLSMRGLTDEYRAALRVLGKHSPAVSQDTREMEDAAYASGEFGDAQERLTKYIEADKEALAAETKAMAESTARKEENARITQELAAATGDYFTAAIEAGDNQEDLNSILYDAADAAGANAFALAGLMSATGDYTKEQINAALQTAAVTAEAQRLGEAIAAGTMTVGEATSALQGFAQDWTASATINTEESKFRDLLKSLIDFDGKTFRATADVSTSGSVPSGATPSGATPSGKGGAKVPEFATGGTVPGPFGSPQLILAHGGETVTPPGQNSLSVVQNFYGSSPNTMTQARDGLMEAARAIGLTGYA